MMKTIFLPFIFVLAGAVQLAYGQGEALFKAKCNTCHMVDKNSTGPILKGVKQKWADAGEGELLYKWVTNSKALIEGGSSKMAAAIKDFSASEMPPQQATNEEIDQILDYVDNYVAAPAAATSPTATAGAAAAVEVKIVPNYEENLNIFYALLAVTLVLILAILMLTNSIMSLIKSDVFKNKLKEKEDKNGSNLGKIITILVVGLGLLVPMDSFALEFVSGGESKEKSLWLIVENADIYALLIINFLLLFVVFYLKRLFNSFYRMAYPETVKTRKEKTKKVTKVLTDAVAIEDEASILMDHEYDGIRELDNNLPPWWVWGFYITIFFAIIYLLNFHVFKTSDLQEVAYKKEMAQAQKDIDAYLKSQAMNVDETNVTKLDDATALAEGKNIFVTNCAVCHKDNGAGDIGPNLTDKFWIYGNDIKDVFKTVKNGTPNGMPDHASKLNPIQLQQVSSFILSLKPVAGKEPQGKEVK
jgi:cytochrome c oxidase cbb3-type subunit 3